MGGKGGGGQTQQVTNAPAQYLVPYLAELLQRGNTLTNQGYNFPNLQTAPLNQTELQGLAGEISTASALEGSLVPGSVNTLSYMLSPQYLNVQQDPTLQNTYQAAAQPLINDYQYAIAPSEMTNAELTGSFGGSGDATARLENQFGLGENLSNLSAQIFGGAEQQRQQLQAGALSEVPTIEQTSLFPSQTIAGAGGVQQEQQQAELNTQYQNLFNQAEFPYQQLSYLANIIAAAGGGAGTSTASTSGGGNMLTGAIGGGLTGAGIGSMFGPWGALIGGGIGALGGSFL